MWAWLADGECDAVLFVVAAMYLCTVLIELLCAKQIFSSMVLYMFAVHSVAALKMQSVLFNCNDCLSSSMVRYPVA